MDNISYNTQYLSVTKRLEISLELRKNIRFQIAGGKILVVLLNTWMWRRN